MAKFGTVKGKESSEDFTIPYETTEALLEKGLVKELKTKVNAKEEEPLHSVEASTVDSLMSDEKAESSIEEDAIHSRREGKKDIINIDTLSENFNDGDTVDLDALLEKKLVSANTGYVKVLARGVLDKKLIVDLDDFSLQAVKMIVLMGGRAKKVK
jgi:ribosomal protein L15